MNRTNVPIACTSGGEGFGRVRGQWTRKLLVGAVVLLAVGCGSSAFEGGGVNRLLSGDEDEAAEVDSPMSVADAVASAQANFDEALRGAPIEDELEFGFLGSVPIRLVSSFDAASQKLVFEVELDVPDAGQALASQIEFTFWENLVQSGGIESYNTILLDSLAEAGIPASDVGEWATAGVRLTSASMEIDCPDLADLVGCVDAVRQERPAATPRPTAAPAATPQPTVAPPPTAVPTATALPLPTATPVPPTPVPATPIPLPTAIPTAVPQPIAPAPQACTPGYSPCIPPGPDVDCAGGSGNGPRYSGRVTVTGSDPYGLDRDNDGIGCE